MDAQATLPRRREVRVKAPGDSLCRIPDDILDNILLDILQVEELCLLAQTSKRFRALAYVDARWKAASISRWGRPSVLTELAATIAGSWRLLYASKHNAEHDAAPWHKPCSFEIDAAIKSMVQDKHNSKLTNGEVGVVFLVDGSGSVQEEDFTTMIDFVSTATVKLKSLVQNCKAGIVQFSNDVRVELEPQSVDVDAFKSKVEAMVRMNGGTNIATSIQKAGQLLKNHLEEDAMRIVVLLTDGRVDSYQAREAVQMADRLVDEQRNVSFYAFGVGRGVDKAELIRIISAADCKDAHNRYMELWVRDEAPW